MHISHQAKSGETGFEVSDAVNDVKPPRVVSAKAAIEENGVAENGNSEETAKQVSSTLSSNSANAVFSGTRSSKPGKSG